MTGRTPAEVEAAAAVLRHLAMPSDRDDYVEWVAEQALDAAGAAAPPSVCDAAVRAVLGLHWDDGHGQCARCEDPDTGQPEPFPCTTRRALALTDPVVVTVTTHAGQQVRSDLTGLGAREAGLTVYPATDARSTDQDVTG